MSRIAQQVLLQPIAMQEDDTPGTILQLPKLSAKTIDTAFTLSTENSTR